MMKFIKMLLTYCTFICILCFTNFLKNKLLWISRKRNSNQIYFYCSSIRVRQNAYNDVTFYFRQILLVRSFIVLFTFFVLNIKYFNTLIQPANNKASKFGLIIY